jgi:hypothetical protein
MSLMSGRSMARRGPGGAGWKDEPPLPARAARSETAVAPTASAPSLGPATRPTTTPRATGATDDFSDIEAILKKHGI